jgi:outer membrane protein OmpA-like peptidoglycan-associated protein
MPINRTLHAGLATACTIARTSAYRACCAGIGALLLTSCSSPPKPPSVDESTRRPVNARAAVDLKTCQGDLSRANILVSELARAGIVTAALNKTLPDPGAARANPAVAVCPGQEHTGEVTATGLPSSSPSIDAQAGNLVAVVSFAMGSASWSIEAVDAAALVRRAQGAAVVMIRGRTDATGDSVQETALARRRAEAAAEFFEVAGVPREKLRLTWQGAGDPVAGLRATERGQSRRVEIEFYASAPMLVTLRSKNANESAPERGRPDTAASL